MSKFCEGEFTQSLGFIHTMPIGYYWVVGDRLEYWGLNTKGSMGYDGSLSLQAVCDALNAKAKEIMQGLPTFIFDESEDKLQRIKRVREEAGLGLKEAKDLVEGNQPSCVLIKGGPFDGKCVLTNSISTIIPVGVIDVMKLQVEGSMTFSQEDVWNLTMDFGLVFMTRISKSTIEGNYYCLVAHKYGDDTTYELGYSHGSEDVVLSASLEQCFSVSKSLNMVYKEGQLYAAQRFQETCDAFFTKGRA
jgi:hypothetical protein